MLAGLLLAEAGMHDGLNCVQTQSYGPEARLGSAKSDVILSSAEIAFPQVVQPDLLLCLSRDSYLKYGTNLVEGGMRIVDSSVTFDVDVTDSIVLPIVDTAEQVGGAISANVVSLGVITTLRDLVSEASLRRCLEQRVKPKHLALNIRAFEAGIELASAVGATR